jgi:hypothetical protein
VPPALLLKPSPVLLSPLPSARSGHFVDVPPHLFIQNFVKKAIADAMLCVVIVLVDVWAAFRLPPRRPCASCARKRNRLLPAGSPAWRSVRACASRGQRKLAVFPCNFSRMNPRPDLPGPCRCARTTLPTFLTFEPVLLAAARPPPGHRSSGGSTPTLTRPPLKRARPTGGQQYRSSRPGRGRSLDGRATGRFQPALAHPAHD